MKARPSVSGTERTSEGSGAVVLSTPALRRPTGRDDDRWPSRHRWNVVATLVPEEDVWQFETTETCTTETQMQDRGQESMAVGLRGSQRDGNLSGLRRVNR